MAGSDETYKKYSDALLSIVKSPWLDGRDHKEACRQITKVASETLDVERTSVWMYNDNDRTGVHCIELYEKKTGGYSDGGTLLRSDYPSYFDALETNRVVDAHDASTDPRTVELAGPYSEGLGISSILDGPTRLNGELIGIMCVEHVGVPRRWSTEEIAFVGSLTDILAHAVDARNRVLLEQELRETESRHARAAKIAKLGHWAWDVIEDKSIYISEMEIAVNGVTVDGDRSGSLSRTDLIERIHADDRDSYTKTWIRAIEDKSGYEVDFRMFDSADKILHVREIAEPIVDTTGQLTQIVGTRMDITTLKETELALNLALTEAELANQSKSQFLATMSHDLRTPLNAIIGFSDMMREQAFGSLGNKKYEEYSDHIHKSGKLLVSLVNDILDLSKIEAGKYDLDEASIDLHALLLDLIQQNEVAAGQDSPTIRLNIPDMMPKLQGDERAVTQIFNNVLSNAVKFTNKVGTVAIDVSVNEMNAVTIVVEDNGIGISDHDLSVILSPFEQANSQMTRRSEGVGLGLFIAQNLMQLHDGTFQIHSTLGQGTTVTSRFPSVRSLSAQ